MKADKIKEWLDRYFLPIMLSLVFSLILGLGLELAFHKPVITALGGTWGDNLGFYGLIIYRDIRDRIKRDEKITFIGILKVVRNLIAEFGPAEYIDSFIIRPALMVIFPELTGNNAVGIFIAKFAADITFFLPTIVSYEVRKKIFRD